MFSDELIVAKMPKTRLSEFCRRFHECAVFPMYCWCVTIIFCLEVSVNGQVFHCLLTRLSAKKFTSHWEIWHKSSVNTYFSKKNLTLPTPSWLEWLQQSSQKAMLMQTCHSVSGIHAQSSLLLCCSFSSSSRFVTYTFPMAFARFDANFLSAYRLDNFNFA